MRKICVNGVRGRTRVTVAVMLAACVVAGISGSASALRGDLDPAFGGRSHGEVLFRLGVLTGLALQPDGGVVAVGGSNNGTTGDAVATRFRSDGRRDHRFGTVTLPGPTDAHEQAWAAVAQRDGKIVVVGQVTDAGGFADVGVWRLGSRGGPDTTFGGGDGFVEFGRQTGDEVGFDVALDARGRILVGGARMGADRDVLVVRLTAGGKPDPSFNMGLSYLTLDHPGSDAAGAIAVQPDGKILLASHYEGAAGYAVLRITPGSAVTRAALDDSFGANHDGIAALGGSALAGFPPVTDVAVTADGEILALADFMVTSEPTFEASVVRLTSAGVVDAAFGSDTGVHIVVPGMPTNTGEALTSLPHGGVVVVGTALDPEHPFIAKLRRDGGFDRRLGHGGVKVLDRDQSLVDVVALPDGRFVTAGNLALGHNVIYRLRGDLQPPSCGGVKATIVGTKTSDKLVGTPQADVIVGLRGADTITGLDNSDIVCGGRGNDHLGGGSRADALYGQSGRDTLVGGPGHDHLVGGPGRDILRQ